MPYIKQDAREAMARSYAVNAGELNYAITCLIRDYFNRAPCYQTINDIVGALEGAKLEFVRRVVNPYEDSKIKENGDVYV